MISLNIFTFVLEKRLKLHHIHPSSETKCLAGHNRTPYILQKILVAHSLPSRQPTMSVRKPWTAMVMDLPKLKPCCFCHNTSIRYLKIFQKHDFNDILLVVFQVVFFLLRSLVTFNLLGNSTFDWYIYRICKMS